MLKCATVLAAGLCLQAIAAREREEEALEAIRAKVNAAYERESIYALPLRP